MAEGFAPIEIFCCYAREDESWLRKLETHLSLLKRQGLISLWYDRLILPGADWAKTLDSHLETASVILLLVSADFFASDYCYGIEMQRALEREAVGEGRVIPILVRPADWTDAPFARLQVLPTDARPIASWRNKDMALADVAAGIRRVIVEELPLLTASAPRAALPKIWNIPYPRNPFFLGRDAELLQIRQNLHTGQATALSQPQAISGLGGIGKTQLALEYAYRHHQDYQAVMWARAESTEALISSYVAIASFLRLPEQEAKEQEVIVQAVKTWLQKHRGWLLILDNADELALLPDFLPPVLGGHLILTTRASATGRLAHRLEIATLLPEQGALLLLQRAALLASDEELSHASQEERELAVEISRVLGGLPLALDQAGAYLETTAMDLSGYWHLYQQHQADLLRERGGLVPDHPLPVATTWLLSFERIEEQNSAAADLLRVCAFLAPDAIPEEILTAGASVLGSVLAPVVEDAFRLNQAIEALRAYSLVRRDSKEKTLSIHRLVQVVIQDMLEEAERRLWAGRALVVINKAFPDPEPDTWPQCERLLPQALVATQVIKRYQITNEAAGHLLHETAKYLLDRTRHTEAEPLFQQALQIKEQHLGPEHLQIAYLLNDLANVYYNQHKYARAEQLFQRALLIWEQRLGSAHPDTAIALNNLANIYREQGKHAEAEQFYRQALWVRVWNLGPEHLNVAYPLGGLALLYLKQRKYAQAESLFQEALRIWELHLGPEHHRLISPLSSLASLYFEQGKYVEAEPLYQRALQICEQQLGPEHLDAAFPLHSLALLYFEQGRYAEAEPLFRQALLIWEQHLGPEHLEVASSLHNLALIYLKQGKYAQAEPIFQRSLHISLQTKEPQDLRMQDLRMAENMYGLAQIWEAQGNGEEARIYYAHILAIYEQMLGVRHPNTTETRTRLIALLHAMGLHEEAAQLEKTQPEP